MALGAGQEKKGVRYQLVSLFVCSKISPSHLSHQSLAGVTKTPVSHTISSLYIHTYTDVQENGKLS